MLFKSVTLDQLPSIAEQIKTALLASKKKFIQLKGEMGAGKTTLTNELMKNMGIDEEGSSPTFSIVNEYFSVNYGKIYHFDFYRIEDESEAYDIGVEEIFEEDAFCFVEWPSRIENLLPEDSVVISITLDGLNRTIELQNL
ncbi:MAG: tRNA (adenosine(37)-N6)-threonylcarbamoyltransferase complex ATPase subunit type 1 TsaE [Crocinitomicaceae bacterium]